MQVFQIGDIVARKSYGNDVYFSVVNIVDLGNRGKIYVLKGLLHRIQADSTGDDLIKIEPSEASSKTRSVLSGAKAMTSRKFRSFPLLYFSRIRSQPGSILHVDSSREFLDICLEHYKDAKIKAFGHLSPESDQPLVMMELLKTYQPSILVVTGHDSMKKNSNKDAIDSYSNSKYYIASVKEARKYQSSPDKLCIFAGACQSYFEALLSAGANFASSPGRVLINALDPALVSEKISLTDYRRIVTPAEVARVTITGAKGIGGINTRGQLTYI